MRKNKKSLWESAFLSIAVSVLFGLAVTLALVTVFSVLILFVMKSMGLAEALALVSAMTGAYCGSYVCGRYRRHRGAVNGIICGAVIYGAFFLAGLALFHEPTDIKRLLLFAVSGCTGGVCGVNSKRPMSLK